MQLSGLLALFHINECLSLHLNFAAMKKLKISIITATWNSDATLEDTLKSVLDQTYGNVEHVIIDGNSTDKTMDLVRRYADLYRQRGFELKWLSEKDHGIYDAMNKGIKLASGDIVGLLNSDDFYTSPTVLAKVAEVFNGEDGDQVDAVYGDIHYVNPNNLHRCVRYYSSKKFKRSRMRMGFMPAHPSFYCRREIYSEYGLFDTDFKIAADFEQLLRLIYIHRIRTRYVPADFVTMRTGGASSSGLSSHKRIYREHRKAYKKNCVYSNFFLEGYRYFTKVIDICKSRIN